MNGPEQYAAAERWLDQVQDNNATLTVDQQLKFAEVRATLALAAATAMSGINHMDEDDFREWDKVAGVQLDGE